MSEGTLSTRQKLLEVAEELFATKGVEATLVGDIVRGAGQRNPSALRYHFGSREGILQAIMDKYLVQIEKRRAKFLADRPSLDTPRVGIEVLVLPLCELLSSESGRRYLRILGQTAYQLDLTRADDFAPYPSLDATIAALRVVIGYLPEPLINERIRATLLLMTATLTFRARDMAGRRRMPLSHEDFKRNVVAMAVATLTAPDDAA